MFWLQKFSFILICLDFLLLTKVCLQINHLLAGNCLTILWINCCYVSLLTSHLRFVFPCPNIHHLDFTHTVPADAPAEPCHQVHSQNHVIWCTRRTMSSGAPIKSCQCLKQRDLPVNVIPLWNEMIFTEPFKFGDNINDKI